MFYKTGKNKHEFESELKVLVQSTVPVSMGLNWFSVEFCWPISSGKPEPSHWAILKHKNKCSSTRGAVEAKCM